MISWQYLAGFFDGEGSACLVSNGKFGYSINIQFPQSGPEGLILLEEIKSFLEQQNIHITALRSRPPECSSPLSRKIDNRLNICTREDVIKVMEGLLPYVRVKKTKLQDWLRTTKLYPRLPKGGRLTWESRRVNLQGVS